MANSTSISEFKEKVLDAITKDDTLFYAFDAKDCESGSDLINTHIFNYNKMPETVTKPITFMTVMVHVNSRDKAVAFVTPTLEICIYSHNDHMNMHSKVIKDNRNDYISMLLDDMLNGSTEYGGIGELLLVSNTEGAYNENFSYRKLVFESIDINHSVCKSW